MRGTRVTNEPDTADVDEAPGGTNGPRRPTRRYWRAGLLRGGIELRHLLRNPKEVVPGTNMAFSGIKNDQQLNDLIAYLKSQS